MGRTQPPNLDLHGEQPRDGPCAGERLFYSLYLLCLEEVSGHLPRNTQDDDAVS